MNLHAILTQKYISIPTSRYRVFFQWKAKSVVMKKYQTGITTFTLTVLAFFTQVSFKPLQTFTSKMSNFIKTAASMFTNYTNTIIYVWNIYWQKICTSTTRTIIKNTCIRSVPCLLCYICDIKLHCILYQRNENRFTRTESLKHQSELSIKLTVNTLLCFIIMWPN